MEQAGSSWWDVEQQLAVATDRSEVKLDQILDRARTVILGGMIEPAGTDRDVDFGWSPHRPQAITMLKRVDDSRTVGAGIGNPRRIDRRPIRVAGHAALVAAPAHVRSGIRKHHR